MTYTIVSEKINSVVKEEVSRVASQTYTSEGVPMYDAIRITSRDDNELSRLIAEKIDIMLSRFRVFVSSVSADGKIIGFDLPDLPEFYIERIVLVLDRYISMGVVSSWLRDKGNDSAQLYAERSDDAINEAEILMMTRKSIKREGK